MATGSDSALDQRSEGSVVRTRQLAPVSGAASATAIWAAALGLLTTPYLLHTLGQSAYAVFALITIVTAYVSNLVFGFGAATTRFLARATARADRVSEARIVGNSMLIFAGSGAVGGVIAFAAAPFIVGSYAHFPAQLEGDATWALRVGALGVVLAFIVNFAGSTLRAYGRFRVLIGCRAVFGTLTSVTAVTAAALFANVVVVVAAGTAVTLGTCVVLLLAVARTPGLRLRPTFHWPTVRMMAGFSVLIFAGGLAYQAIIQGPPTVLAGEVPSAELAAFAVPAMVLQQLTLLIASASLGFMPFASAESARDSRTRLAAVFRSNLRLTLAVMGPIAGFLIVFADPLLSAWIGSEFASQAADPLRFLAAAALVLSLSGPPADVARGLGHPGWVFVFTLVAAGAAIGTAVLAVGTYGATGAALGLFAGPALAMIPFLLIVSRRLLGHASWDASYGARPAGRRRSRGHRPLLVGLPRDCRPAGCRDQRHCGDAPVRSPDLPLRLGGRRACNPTQRGCDDARWGHRSARGHQAESVAPRG